MRYAPQNGDLRRFLARAPEEHLRKTFERIVDRSPADEKDAERLRLLREKHKKLG